MNTQFLHGKTCLVTGGAEGIGWAIAQALADAGGEVYVCDISQENIARAKNELNNSPLKEKIHFHTCDVAERAQVEGWISAVYQATSRLDVLVNNAAFVRWAPVTEMSIEEMEQMMAVGYYGMLYTIKTALPFMLQARQGHIINMCSSAGRLFIVKGNAAYGAVKAAMDGFGQTLALELQGSGVRLTTVRLGLVEGTDFFRKQVSSTRMPRLGDLMPALTPPQVATGILRVLRTGQTSLDMPGYLPWMYLMFAIAPGVLSKLVNLGGPAQKDYGARQWTYQPHRK
ncbi:MAG: hypothetical protein DDG60_08865 [Anaerolineae bacterium]|nr:MAG: hypothetical protein DDG60_08865 [Anaerolineae bacterium]